MRILLSLLGLLSTTPLALAVTPLNICVNSALTGQARTLGADAVRVLELGPRK